MAELTVGNLEWRWRDEPERWAVLRSLVALGGGRSEIALRIARVGAVFTFHASHDGESWQLIRYFALDSHEPARFGFQAQSPRGKGATIRFAEIALARERLADIRNGE